MRVAAQGQGGDGAAPGRCLWTAVQPGVAVQDTRTVGKRKEAGSTLPLSASGREICHDIAMNSYELWRLDTGRRLD